MASGNGALREKVRKLYYHISLYFIYIYIFFNYAKSFYIISYNSFACVKGLNFFVAIFVSKHFHFFGAKSVENFG